VVRVGRRPDRRAGRRQRRDLRIRRRRPAAPAVEVDVADEARALGRHLEAFRQAGARSLDEEDPRPERVMGSTRIRKSPGPEIDRKAARIAEESYFERLSHNVNLTGGMFDPLTNRTYDASPRNRVTKVL